MPTRRIIFYWLLILLPSLAIGGLALYYISHEKDLLAAQQRTALSDQGRRAAEDILLVVDNLQNGLSLTLETLPEVDRESALTQLGRMDALVRSVFLFDQAAEKVVLPSPDDLALPESQNFIRRYDALFSGRIPWFQEDESRPASTGELEKLAATASEQKASSDGWLASKDDSNREKKSLSPEPVVAYAAQTQEDYASQGVVNFEVPVPASPAPQAQAIALGDTQNQSGAMGTKNAKSVDISQSGKVSLSRQIFNDYVVGNTGKSTEPLRRNADDSEVAQAQTVATPMPNAVADVKISAGQTRAENQALAKYESVPALGGRADSSGAAPRGLGLAEENTLTDQQLALKEQAPREADVFMARASGGTVVNEASPLASLDKPIAPGTLPMPSAPAPASGPELRKKERPEVVLAEQTRAVQPAPKPGEKQKAEADKAEQVLADLSAPTADVVTDDLDSVGEIAASSQVRAEKKRLQAEPKPAAKPTSRSSANRLDEVSWSGSQAEKRDNQELEEKSMTAGDAVDRDQQVSLRLPSLRSAWRPWNWENSFFLLGFVEDPLRRQIFGVELELLALLARLPAALDGGSTAAFVLRDQLGSTYFQSRPVARAETAVDVFSLGPALPFFELAVFPADPAAFARLGRGSFVAMALLVGVFLAAIASGGGLLIAQTRRSWKEAMQKTSFVSNVSHELKTPLTTLRMYTEMLSGGKVSGEKQKQYLEVMLTEGERLSRLVGNVLDFSRLEEGRKKYQRETYDLSSQVEQVVEGARLAFERPDLSLTMVPAGTPLMVNTDRDAVEQILLNLLDNAAKYGGSGGEIRVVADAPRGKPRIRVMDRGPGVSHDQREKIFEKFHRVDSSLTATQGGCGLGLSIARRLARDLGGDLRYENRPGGGAVFILELPAAEKEPA